jgi:hypothetical protein
MLTLRSAAVGPLPRRQVLAELPERVVKFLRASGAHAGVRAALASGGYSAADHKKGWELLGQACAYSEDGRRLAEDLAARAALGECVNWVSSHFPRLRAALDHLHPEDLALFSGIEAPEPRGAAAALGTLLRRLDLLEAEGASSAFETLTRRGLDHVERLRLAKLVDAAQRAPTVEGPPIESLQASRDAELLALYRWYADWSTTALAVIQRKDYLIALGLARRERARGAASAG